jgi:hypothetical protein
VVLLGLAEGLGVGLCVVPVGLGVGLCVVPVGLGVGLCVVPVGLGVKLGVGLCVAPLRVGTDPDGCVADPPLPAEAPVDPLPDPPLDPVGVELA